MKKDLPYLNFLAYLQVLGIILVVIGHSFHEHPEGYFGYNLFPIRLIYSFHMPLFLFVSGFLFIYSTNLKHERTGIYIPWMIYRFLVENNHLRWVKAISFLLGQKLNAKKKEIQTVPT